MMLELDRIYVQERIRWVEILSDFGYYIELGYDRVVPIVHSVDKTITSTANHWDIGVLAMRECYSMSMLIW